MANTNPQEEKKYTFHCVEINKYDQEVELQTTDLTQIEQVEDATEDKIKDIKILGISEE